MYNYKYKESYKAPVWPFVTLIEQASLISSSVMIRSSDFGGKKKVTVFEGDN